MPSFSLRFRMLTLQRYTLFANPQEKSTEFVVMSGKIRIFANVYGQELPMFTRKLQL